jgi:hypothetical protein
VAIDPVMEWITRSTTQLDKLKRALGWIAPSDQPSDVGISVQRIQESAGLIRPDLPTVGAETRVRIPHIDQVLRVRCRSG